MIMNESDESLNSEIDSRAKLELPSPTQDVEDRMHSGTLHQCTVCNKSYTTVSGLNRHHRAVHEQVRYACSLCSKSYSSLSHLSNHHRAVHERVGHSCSVCNKLYPTVSHLKSHHREVHDRVRHPCSVCSKTFSRASDVKKHVREIHDGRRTEFECNECKKVFYKKCYLKRHKQVNSEKQFHRVSCHQSYSNSGSLREHIQRKHKQDQEGGTIENTSDVHTEVPDASTEDEGMNQIHSFMIKVEDESEEEGEGEDKEEM